MNQTTCSFIGLGLIGGSVAKALKSHNENIIINLYCANVETQTAEKDLKGIYELENVQINSESVTGVINIRHNLDINMGLLRYNTNFPNLSL